MRVFRFTHPVVAFGLVLLIAGCASAPRQTGGQSAGAAPHVKIGAPYKINGRWYRPAADPNYDARGVASWYGDKFHGRPTANGETFDMRQMTAAHTTLPLPSYVEVTNLENGKRAVVRVNDRGPFAKNRIIDLSRAAARALGFEKQGLAKVRVRYVGPAALPGEGAAPVVAAAPPRPAITAAPAAMPAAPPDDDDLAALIAASSPPGAASPSPPAMAATSDAPLFAVEIATIETLDALPSMRAALDFDAPLRIATLNNAGPARYRIELGPFFTRGDAETRLAAVRKAGYENAALLVVSP